MGSGVHPTPTGIPFGIAASAILSTGDYRARLAILGSVGGSSHPCSLPRVWGRLHGSLLFCFRKRRRACVTLRPGLGPENDECPCKLGDGSWACIQR
ncbi:hypothetical protein E4K67_19400 [Desulfosporosinus fructosivorans]|uniref:Uncharacterized protein n=1 Tax=Desulfosporosinus fructosivorans TaxID=2018669 RepID=A0A4Z0R1X1_9FIRM|nr:hypothetical protein [Desulfosporosinus fructosivorans]TGE36604.1 hypothetical protein E4K67_19400 [Desulfosporosinus fructosivorans]